MPGVLFYIDTAYISNRYPTNWNLVFYIALFLLIPYTEFMKMEL